MLFKSGDADSDVGKEIIRATVSKLKTLPEVRLLKLHVQNKISPNVNPDVIETHAIACMIRIDKRKGKYGDNLSPRCGWICACTVSAPL